MLSVSGFSQNTNWTGAGADSLWTNAANWSSGVPTASMTARILNTLNDPYVIGNPQCKNLILDDTLTVGPSTPMIVNGDITINGAGYINLQSNVSLTLTGNWNQTGGFNPSTSNVTFSGNKNVTIRGTAFFDLSVSKSGGKKFRISQVM
ncbi:MAG: hypothetical protein K2X86_01770 [Cytophagaceae bacterium]|nr:hypothetical protein [Cytophagaceae bacterium]